MFCGEFGWVTLLVVRFLYETVPNPTKNYLLWEKSGPIATFNLIFLWLGRPKVEEFAGFIIIFTWYELYVFQPNITWYVANTLITLVSRVRFSAWTFFLLPKNDPNCRERLFE